MVDELELLKKDWKKQDISLPKLSREELYPMLLKKSSSIVKWILIISIIEFAFWILLNTIVGQDSVSIEYLEKMDLKIVDNIMLALNYIILAYFIVRFFLNYKIIKTTDNSRELMRNILKARNTVKQYIWFNIIYLFLGTIIVFGISYSNRPDIYDKVNPFLLLAVILLVVGIISGILLLLYKVIYGRLVKRLKVNYDQLKKLEI